MRRGQPGRLSPLKLKQLAKTVGLHADGGGLYLAVTQNKQTGTLRQSWVFLYIKRGKRTMMGGGSLHTITLKEAREWALKQRKLLVDGADPLTAKRVTAAIAVAAAAKALTFDECRDRYLAEHEKKWRSARHRKEWEGSLQRYITPVFGKMLVKDIDRAMVIKALEPVWKQYPETASRVRGRIETILDYATVSGLREGPNPASWKLLRHKFPKAADVAPTKNLPAMDYRLVPQFLIELHKDTSIAAAALLFGIYTATRSQELRGARFDECDLDERVWSVPAARMKSGREHRVPLSDAAMDVLARMSAIRQGPYVFPGRGGGCISKDAVNRLLRKMRPDVVPHGFRSSMSTWRAERTSFSAELMEAALAHILGDKTMAAYQRGDLFVKRRKLMDAWADYVSGAEPRVGRLRAVS
jgi:integrase